MADTWVPADPTREDAFVRGLSEAVGGPIGEHAARPSPGMRFWTVPRIVIVLALLVFGLHWIQKSPCQDGNWQNQSQFTHFCYSDVLALYYSEHLNEGAVPYFDWPVEYPVLTGYFMGVLGLPVHDLGTHDPRLNQPQAFYNLNALVLIAFGIATVAVLLALRRRRPWDAAMLALAPAMVVTATVNWDLLVVGLSAFFLYAWARKLPWLAGVMLGLAVAAKFYPFLFVGALLILAARTGRWRSALITIGTAAVTWFAVNAPVLFFANQSWQEFWSLSSRRQIDWGTLWYMGTHLELPTGTGLGLFNTLGAHIPVLNNVIYLLLALCCAGVAVLALRAPQPPRLSQLCFLLVALFLLTSKVWSQQFVLWLIPLAVLARPRWGAFLAWQVAEIGYFLSFYAQYLNAVPAGIFLTASALRWGTVAALVFFVLRDIMQPNRDVVRVSYGDDPEGGDFNGVPGPERYEVWRDRWDDWLQSRREREHDRRAGDHAGDSESVDR